MSTPESKIKAKVNRFLKPLIDAGKIHKLMPVQRGMGTVGLDYHLCVAGHYVCVETKRDSNHRLTDRQEETRRQIVCAGGTVCVVFDGFSLDTLAAVVQNCLVNQANWRS